jgi:hypothetical protein
MVLKYDSKGLFLHAVATYFEEDSKRCKTALETVMKAICQLHSQQKHVESPVHNLVMDWLAAKTTVHVGIGAKVMTFILEDKVIFNIY